MLKQHYNKTKARRAFIKTGMKLLRSILSPQYFQLHKGNIYDVFCRECLTQEQISFSLQRIATRFEPDRFSFHGLIPISIYLSFSVRGLIQILQQDSISLNRFHAK